MSPAHVFEPTYDALKRRLMAGAWGAGQRLEAARLADELGVSITPVRDSLARLAAERLVDFVHGEGFRVPKVTEAELRDLFELQMILLLAALASRGARDEPGRPAEAGGDGGTEVQSGSRDGADTYAARLAALFAAIARRSDNAELVRTVAALSDRLHLAHVHLAAMVCSPEADFSEIAEAAVQPGDAALRARLMLHYGRGSDASEALVRLMEARRVAPGQEQ